MESRGAFDDVFSLIWEKVSESALLETSKLVESSLQKMLAELAQARHQNNILKADLYKDDIPSPLCKVGIYKRDVGVQCDAVITPSREEPNEMKTENEGFTVVVVKQEEPEGVDETQPPFYAKVPDEKPRLLLKRNGSTAQLSPNVSLVPVHLGDGLGALRIPTVSLTPLKFSEVSAMHRNNVPKTGSKVTVEEGTETFPEEQESSLQQTGKWTTSAREGKKHPRQKARKRVHVDSADEGISDPLLSSGSRNLPSQNMRSSSRETPSKYRRPLKSENPADGDLHHTDGQKKKSPGKEKRKNQCEVCDRVLSSATSLECHRRIHSGERPCVCEECGKGFPDARGLRRHQHIHKPKRHVCTECGKGFVYVFQLTNHKVIHTTAMDYACSVCGKQFKSKSTRDTHMHLHTGAKPFPCPICPKEFRHRMSFNTHMQRHRGEKPYNCTICKKSFADPNNLKAHKRVHTGERPYVCKVCDKKFKQSAHLKKHLATQH